MVETPTVLLVGSTGAMGEPLDLYCTDGGRHPIPFRVWDQPGSHATPRRSLLDDGTIRTSSGTDYGSSSNRERFLLPRCSLRRATRPQHSILEVVAGLRRHRSTRKTRCSYSCFAAPKLRHHRCDTTPYAPHEQCDPCRHRHNTRTVDTDVSVPCSGD